MSELLRKANRLIHETSPYLLQHARNPVDWYPWGREALERAAAEAKPILLSVGYSSCHWCHVMERECFENPAIAALMNERFVCIKVDREERPDIDQIYQNVAQLVTRSGGWPLTVFLTPDLKPFFGGTYFPPEDRHGRPGFPRVLAALSDAFQKDAVAVLENASRLCRAIESLESLPPGANTQPNKADLKAAADALLANIDWRHGGFGSAPKFPSTMSLAFLWRWGTLAQMGQAQDAVLLSLEQMARGGIFDQLGGGFHRYSVDESWSVPHFEKMLYDNGLLLKLYSEALLTPLATDLAPDQKNLFLETVQRTVDYVLREMTDPETGAFYSAQDADSAGEEGTFFVWNPQEIAETLGSVGSDREAPSFSSEDKALVCRYFGVTEAGNFSEHGESTGKTVLHRPRGVEFPKERIDAVIQTLFRKREAREKPFRDEKSLTAWNALMVSGLSWASLALAENPENGNAERAGKAGKAAERAFEFLRVKMAKDPAHLWSVYKDGTAKIDAFLDDYAFSAAAALDLARICEEKTDALWSQARAWINTVWDEFYDSTDAAFFFTSKHHEKLISRPKTLFDQAIPSGTAVALSCSALLAEYFADSALFEKTEASLCRLFGTLQKNAFGISELANASLLWFCAPTVLSRPPSQRFVHPFLVWKNEKSGPLTACRKQSCSELGSDSKKYLGDHLLKTFA